MIEEGIEVWTKRLRDQWGNVADKYDYNRNYTKYRVIDRLTGSENIEVIYHN